MPLRTNQELRAASDHVGYEVWMLRESAAQLRRMEPGQDRNATLESLTIHARALRQFFEPTRPRPDDVLAWHYVGDRVHWQQLRAECQLPSQTLTAASAAKSSTRPTCASS
jgi:hypothetical protein